MKTGLISCNDSIGIWQWGECFRKYIGNYYVVAMNIPLAYPQGVDPVNIHVECIVDDFGNLVRVA